MLPRLEPHEHRGAALHWLQNGHPMKTVHIQHRGMLGVSEAVVYCMKRHQGTAAIWKQRKANTNVEEGAEGAG
jgi:hypothetical protein